MPRRSPRTRPCGTPGPPSTRRVTSTTSRASSAGGIRLRRYEIELVGDVAGRSLLHLQCHFGIDTLSWARLGARVTGADFSPAAVELRTIARGRARLPGRALRAREPVRPARRPRRRRSTSSTPRVACSAGCPTSARWARVVAHFLAPGGRFFITEIHPVAQVVRERGRGRRRASPQLPVLGARRAAHLRGAGLVRRPDAPTSASTPSTAGTTASARS